MRIREKVGVLKQLKRELWQTHKLSRTESGFPGIHWWHLKYWDIEGWVKKETSSIPLPIPYHPFIMLQIPRSEQF